MYELYSGTESAVRCGDTISNLFPVVTGVHLGYAGSHTFQRLYGLDSGEDVREINLLCIVNVNISNLDFADDGHL